MQIPVTITFNHTVVCGMLALLTPFVYADSVMTPRDPEAPWEGDPDISAIEDERIVELWEDTMVEYRRNNPTGMSTRSIWGCEKYRAEPHAPEDQELLIDALAEALEGEDPDWNYVRTVLLLMQRGMSNNPAIPRLAHHMFTLPRPVKMSNAHGSSFSAMLRILSQQNTAEAAELLYDACSRDYWGDAPMHTPAYSRHYSEISIRGVRVTALAQLSRMSPDLSIPWLEKLADAYPENYEPPTMEIKTGYRFTTTREVEIDFDPARIRRKLAAAYEALAEQETTTRQE